LKQVGDGPGLPRLHRRGIPARDARGRNVVKPNARTIPCPRCDGARRIADMNPGETSRCAMCHGTGVEAPTLGDLADMAAGSLPDGWEIQVRVEHEATWVDLISPERNEVDYPSNHETIEGSFADALEFAIEEGAKAS
jgi:hypothetical protein